MLKRFFKELTLSRPPADSEPKPTALEEEIQAEARVFERTLMLDRPATEGDIDTRISALTKDDFTDTFLSGLAAWTGERLRTKHGGSWSEDSAHGLVLSGVLGVAHVRAFPLAIAIHKTAKSDTFSIQTFMNNVDEGLRREKAFTEYHSSAPSALDGHGFENTPTTARELAESFRSFWLMRFGRPLPPSLHGVRQMDSFLRSQYLFATVRDETIAQSGFFLGEVARSLFQGEWDFTKARETGAAKDAALCWPEIDLYPIGRIYKMLTERPDADPLDEYIRLIPSARSELRKTANNEETPDG